MDSIHMGGKGAQEIGNDAEVLAWALGGWRACPDRTYKRKSASLAFPLPRHSQVRCSWLDRTSRLSPPGADGDGGWGALTAD